MLSNEHDNLTSALEHYTRRAHALLRRVVPPVCIGHRHPDATTIIRLPSVLARAVLVCTPTGCPSQIKPLRHCAPVAAAPGALPSRITHQINLSTAAGKQGRTLLARKGLATEAAGGGGNGGCGNGGCGCCCAYPGAAWQSPSAMRSPSSSPHRWPQPGGHRAACSRAEWSGEV